MHVRKIRIDISNTFLMIARARLSHELSECYTLLQMNSSFQLVPIQCKVTLKIANCIADNDDFWDYFCCQRTQLLMG